MTENSFRKFCVSDYRKYCIVDRLENVIASFDTKTEMKRHILSKMGSNLNTDELRRYHRMFGDLMFKAHRYIEFDDGVC